MKSANADEIFGFASDEIKSTHPPSRRISPNEVGFHRRRRFHPPARVDLVENDRFLSESVVFWRRRWDSNPRAVAGKLISSVIPCSLIDRKIDYFIVFFIDTIYVHFQPP